MLNVLKIKLASFVCYHQIEMNHFMFIMMLQKFQMVKVCVNQMTKVKTIL
jgi:hypothetical protein